MKNTALQVVLDNTDGVTVAKLARTAKIELTPVHHLRISMHKKETFKNASLKIHADWERYNYGDIPVEVRVIEEEFFGGSWLSGAEWVDKTRVIKITRGPARGLADETFFWEKMLTEVSDQLEEAICRYEKPESDGEYTEVSDGESEYDTDPEDYTDHRYLLFFPIRHEM